MKQVDNMNWVGRVGTFGPREFTDWNFRHLCRVFPPFSLLEYTIHLCFFFFQLTMFTGHFVQSFTLRHLAVGICSEKPVQVLFLVSRTLNQVCTFGGQVPCMPSNIWAILLAADHHSCSIYLFPSVIDLPLWYMFFDHLCYITDKVPCHSCCILSSIPYTIQLPWCWFWFKNH
jgi:hypothetical protein